MTPVTGLRTLLKANGLLEGPDPNANEVGLMCVPILLLYRSLTYSSMDFIYIYAKLQHARSTIISYFLLGVFYPIGGIGHHNFFTQFFTQQYITAM